jgi:hypothetical protein
MRIITLKLNGQLVQENAFKTGNNQAFYIKNIYINKLLFSPGHTILLTGFVGFHQKRRTTNARTKQ